MQLTDFPPCRDLYLLPFVRDLRPSKAADKLGGFVQLVLAVIFHHCFQRFGVGVKSSLRILRGTPSPVAIPCNHLQKASVLVPKTESWCPHNFLNEAPSPIFAWEAVCGVRHEFTKVMQAGSGVMVSIFLGQALKESQVCFLFRIRKQTQFCGRHDRWKEVEASHQTAEAMHAFSFAGITRIPRGPNSAQ